MSAVSARASDIRSHRSATTSLAHPDQREKVDLNSLIRSRDGFVMSSVRPDLHGVNHASHSCGAAVSSVQPDQREVDMDSTVRSRDLALPIQSDKTKGRAQTARFVHVLALSNHLRGQINA